jgi:tetratricopeptide (TPR) repeat protein
MFAPLRSPIVAVLLLLSLQFIVLGQEAKAPTTDAGLAAAGQVYRARRFEEAEAGYQALLKTDAKLVPAQVGLIRSMMAQGKVNEAVVTVNAALAAQPNSASLLAVTGDIQFRKGEMSDAEKWYLAAQEHDPNEVSAHLGLARWYSSYSMYRKAYDQLQIAHQIAPDDFAVQVAWIGMLPQKQKLAAIESYLARSHPDHEEETKVMTEYLEFLKTTADQSIHACRLVSKVEQTETKLEAIRAVNSHRMSGIGLKTKVNAQDVLLQLDTGASGIILDRRAAEKAGLARISAAHMRGIGDHGERSGYRAVADHIRIGELEFQDCVVLVTDKPRPEFHGLIGADVFASYLVDIDLPEMRLKLSPLPKRPEDAAAPTSLNSEAEEPSNAEQDVDSTSQQASTKQPLSTPGPRSSPQRLPRDRYVAPEMVRWTQVFRFGHLILVPTNVNGSRPMLFLLDTGSPGNVLSTRAGQQVSTVHPQNRLGFTGLSGKVNNVYISSEATLRFGHVEQRITDITTFDLSSIGQGETEVSGLLGFATLKLLEVKLDYRDGMVNFEYDPKHGK